MNKHLFQHKLNGTDLSKTLSLLSTIEFILGIIFAALTFLISFVMGVIAAANTYSIGAFLLMFFGGAITAVAVFYLSFVFSVLLKGFASVVLHSYISALNSEH